MGAGHAEMPRPVRSLIEPGNESGVFDDEPAMVADEDLLLDETVSAEEAAIRIVRPDDPNLFHLQTEALGQPQDLDVAHVPIDTGVAKDVMRGSRGKELEPTLGVLNVVQTDQGAQSDCEDARPSSTCSSRGRAGSGT